MSGIRNDGKVHVSRPLKRLTDCAPNLRYDYTGLTQEQSYGDGWQRAFHPEDSVLSGKRWAYSLATGVSSLTTSLSA